MQPGIGRRGVDAGLDGAIGCRDVRVEDGQGGVRAVRSREHIGDGPVVDRHGLAMALYGGRLPEKRCRLRQHAFTIGGPCGARPIDESAHLHEPRAIRLERERVRRRAGWEGYPDNEGENESAPQDCGKASAASWRSNASLRTRRS